MQGALDPQRKMGTGRVSFREARAAGLQGCGAQPGRWGSMGPRRAAPALGGPVDGTVLGADQVLSSTHPAGSQPALCCLLCDSVLPMAVDWINLEHGQPD